MNHLDVLGEHNGFKYVFHNYYDSKSELSYTYMNKKIKELGYMVTSDWLPDKSILLEDDSNAVAGIFFNTTKYNKVVLILIAYVKEEFRQQGIYSQLHRYVDHYGTVSGKNTIYTYIHCNNILMVETISKKIGYEPVMYLMKREIVDRSC